MKEYIIYKDDDLIALNKPVGWICHPVGSFQGDSIVSRLEYYYGSEAKILHRLDKNTSGVILIARNAQIVPHLYKQFFRRTISKTYLAIVYGAVQPQKNTISLPIGKAKNSIIQLKMEVNEDGFPCETSYECLASNDEYSLLLVKPVTGRKHQIRLHLANAGYPIVGDDLYYKSGLPFLWEYYFKNPSPWQSQIPGQALHAYSITFHHPAYDKEITITAEPPNHFKQIFPRQKYL